MLVSLNNVFEKAGTSWVQFSLLKPNLIAFLCGLSAVRNGLIQTNTEKYYKHLKDNYGP